MNDDTAIIIAVSIVAAAVILKLPIGPQPGRYQVATGQWGAIRIGITTGDAWQGMNSGPWVAFRDNGARP